MYGLRAEKGDYQASSDELHEVATSTYDEMISPLETTPRAREEQRLNFSRSFSTV